MVAKGFQMKNKNFFVASFFHLHFYFIFLFCFGFGFIILTFFKKTFFLIKNKNINQV